MPFIDSFFIEAFLLFVSVNAMGIGAANNPSSAVSEALILTIGTDDDDIPDTDNCSWRLSSQSNASIRRVANAKDGLPDSCQAREGLSSTEGIILLQFYAFILHANRE